MALKIKSQRSYKKVKGYVRKDGKRIKPHYRKVKTVNLLPKPTKGKLSQFGYRVSVGITTRKVALRKAVNVYGWQSVSRELNLIANLTYRTQPKNSRVYEADKQWVRKTFGKK